MRTISETTRALAERLGSPALSLEVVASEAVAGSYRRLTLSDPSLSAVPFLPGQDLTIAVPRPDGSGPVRRRYTIRRLDRDRGVADIDVCLHSTGPGSRWAAAASIGDHVEAIGPRGKITVDRGAGWHLFVGDESYVPAACTMAEALPADAGAVLVLEAAEEPEHPVTAARCDGPRWARPGQLLEVLGDVVLAPASAHAYLGGEARLVAAVREALVAKGLPLPAISAKPYWRAEQANADHGEPVVD